MMPVRRVWLRALGLAALAWGSIAPMDAIAQDPRASFIVSLAREWLAKIDAGDVAGSHAEAGAKFRAALSLGEWKEALARERVPRGTLMQRTVVQTAFDPKLANVPPGEYAVLQFRTAFERQSFAMETVTLERESDGRWRVIGYFVR